MQSRQLGQKVFHSHLRAHFLHVPHSNSQQGQNRGTNLSSSPFRYPWKTSWFCDEKHFSSDDNLSNSLEQHDSFMRYVSSKNLLHQWCVYIFKQKNKTTFTSSQEKSQGQMQKIKQLLQQNHVCLPHMWLSRKRCMWLRIKKIKHQANCYLGNEKWNWLFF